MQWGERERDSQGMRGIHSWLSFSAGPLTPPRLHRPHLVTHSPLPRPHHGPSLPPLDPLATPSTTSDTLVTSHTLPTIAASTDDHPYPRRSPSQSASLRLIMGPTKRRPHPSGPTPHPSPSPPSHRCQAVVFVVAIAVVCLVYAMLAAGLSTTAAGKTATEASPHDMWVTLI